jgi:hypothetical protein
LFPQAALNELLFWGVIVRFWKETQIIGGIGASRPVLSGGCTPPFLRWACSPLRLPGGVWLLPTELRCSKAPQDQRIPKRVAGPLRASPSQHLLPACAAKASARFRSSSGGTSSMCVPIQNKLPQGSLTPPMRSPQNWLAGSMTDVAPASTAFR